MGRILYLVSPFHRLHQRRPTRKPQPVFTLAPLCTNSASPTARASSWRWRAFLTEFSHNVRVTTSRAAARAAAAATATATATRSPRPSSPKQLAAANNDNKQAPGTQRNNYTLYCWRSHKHRVEKEKKMERLVAIPSAALSLSVLVLAAAIDSTNASLSPSPSGFFRSLLGMGVGFGLNFATLAPILTLAWHAFTFLPSRPASAFASTSSASTPASTEACSPISPRSRSVHIGQADLSPSSISAMRRTRIWTPHTLAVLWFLYAILILLVPQWTSDTAFLYAGLAVLSGLETGVLALSGVLGQYHVQRELEGESDDECGWEEEEEEEEMKLGDL